MRVPLSDPSREYRLLSEAFDAAYQRVMNAGSYIMGKEHDEFEADLAAYCGVSHCIAVASGSDALELALKVSGCGPGSEVITVANAGGYTTIAALETGARVVFADVDPLTLTISPDSVEALISDDTCAIVVTHLYGKMGDVDAIRSITAGRRIAIIEDCAQAHGAARGGRRAGSFGDMGTFSFYPTKNLGAFGDGGAIVTDNADLAKRLRLVRQYGWSPRYHISVRGGRNSRLDELQAAFLRIKLTGLDSMNNLRRDIVRRYQDAVRGTDITLVHEPASDFVAHLAVARHPDRAVIMAGLVEKGIGTAIHYPVADHQQEIMASVDWRSDRLDHTIAAQREIFTLPCFPLMTPDEVEYVCEGLSSLA